MENTTISKLPYVEKYFHFSEIPSCNDFAKNLDSFPMTGIFIVHADTQKHGRGQRDNSFFSGEGGLYATIVCPLADITSHFVINRSISLAICEAVEMLVADASLSIKWPNDILWAGRKLCGILLESLPRSGHHLAVGFGVNVNTRANQFPLMIAPSATSMSIETGEWFDIQALLGEISLRFQKYRNTSPGKAHDRYRERLYRIGSSIRINGNSGVFETVHEDGRLCLNVNKNMVYLSTGSIQFINPTDG
jgi:BirA family transcriptional regulator, biotin operon repressor / biotin---[acetyl-CoA-carboxylase] ligase